MTLEFEFGNVSVTEFGVGIDDHESRFVAVPVDAGVQETLYDMLRATWSSLQESQDGPTAYEPSEKYGTTEYVYLPLQDPLAQSMRELHEAANLPVNTAVLDDPNGIFCYFARLTDMKGQRVTALRRAAQFKGVLKSRNRLVRMWDNTLKIIEDSVFKLDNDFDLLVDAASVHVLRPSGFESAGKLQQAILEAVPKNIEAIQKDLPFVEFAHLDDYASTHPRAARCLASIRAQDGGKGIDKDLLLAFCEQTGVAVSVSRGKVVVSSGAEMDFLELLDRRRYPVSLVKDNVELYRATGRRKIGAA